MKLNISVYQMAVVAGDIKANLDKVDLYAKEASRRESMVLALPELWTTGIDFVSYVDICFEQDKTIEKIQKIAKAHKIWLTGSMLYHDKEGRATNTSFCFSPKGEVLAHYSKMHLFSLMHEDKHFKPGSKLVVEDLPWGKSGFAICYDIRFPELYRSYALKGAEMVFSPVAFPIERAFQWNHLVRARAIENQMFMVTASQVGTASIKGIGDVKFMGGSVIIDPLGKTVIEAGDTGEVLLTGSIDLKMVENTRNFMQIFKDRKPQCYSLN